MENGGNRAGIFQLTKRLRRTIFNKGKQGLSKASFPIPFESFRCGAANRCCFVTERANKRRDGKWRC